MSEPTAGPLTVGVDIGGSKVLAGVVDPAGRVLARERRDTPAHSAAEVEDAIVDVVARLAAGHDVAAVGVGAAGVVGTDLSSVLFSPHLAWRGEPLGEALRSRIDLPLLLDNDANTAALAETVFGAGSGHRVVLCATVGTGIGGGLVVDGEVYRGAHGAAMEIGHVPVVPDGRLCPCGNRGCWEEYASGDALVREARERVLAGSPMATALRDAAGGDAAALTGPMVTAAARAGDPLAVELFADLGHWLGIGLAGLTTVLDPGCIVLGGGVSAAGDLLVGPTRDSFARHLYGRGFRPEPVVVAAALGPDAGFVGAAEMARVALASA